MARWTAYALARQGWDISLAGRDVQELRRIAADLILRTGATVSVREFQAEDLESHEGFWEDCVDQMEDLRCVVCAFGFMGSQDAQNEAPALAQQVMTINYTAAGTILMHAAKHFEEQKTGWIVGISSVAGERGRASNYVYGSAKAGFTQLLSGLRARLSKSGVSVLTVKPGFVDTAMTFGKDGVFLVADPKDVGGQIVEAMTKRKDVVYIPGFWRLIMFIIRSVPEKVFKKMKF